MTIDNPRAVGAEQAVVTVDEDALVVKELSNSSCNVEKANNGRGPTMAGTHRIQAKGAKGAFISEPSTIEYIDFTPGQRHVLNIKLTNGSLTFNNFKLLPMAVKLPISSNYLY